MSKRENIKIKTEDLTLIFGRNKKEALKMLEKGFSKDEILRKTKCTVGVNKVNLEIEQGKIFVIMGLSGSGKSSLIRCFNRLNEPTSGKIIVNGTDITKDTNKELIEMRRKEMCMVFQKFGLLPHRTVLENVAFGLEIRGEEKNVRLDRAKNSLETVGLKGYENQKPSELSGGMQQRVGLARALANEPQILLMDEAFSALDPLIKSDMQDELLSIQDKLKKTIVFITHDLDEAIKLGDEIAIMKDGVIEQIGSPEDILTNPATSYVEAFVENVDRKTIITAESLMYKAPSVVILGKDGAEVTLRRMRNKDVRTLPVVDKDKKFTGFVWIKDVVKRVKENKESLESIIHTNVPSVYKDYTVEDMLPLITDTVQPIAVIEEETDKLLGIVSQTSLIIESTRFDKKEIKELKNQAKDL